MGNLWVIKKINLQIYLNAKALERTVGEQREREAQISSDQYFIGSKTPF